jgi:Domain of unknown function (DUF1707)
MGKGQGEEEAARERATFERALERLTAESRRFYPVGDGLRYEMRTTRRRPRAEAKGTIMITTTAENTTPFPDYTSIRINLTQAGTSAGGPIWNLMTVGKDGTLLIATYGPAQAEQFLRAVMSSQEQHDYLIRHDAAASATVMAKAGKAIASAVKPPKPALTHRIGDPEKNVTIRKLDDAFTSGYLTQAEFSDRSGKALTATSQAELNALTADLGNVPPQEDDTVTVSKAQVTWRAEAYAQVRHKAVVRWHVAAAASLYAAVMTILFIAGMVDGWH